MGLGSIRQSRIFLNSLYGIPLVTAECFALRLLQVLKAARGLTEIEKKRKNSTAVDPFCSPPSAYTRFLPDTLLVLVTFFVERIHDECVAQVSEVRSQ